VELSASASFQAQAAGFMDLVTDDALMRLRLLTPSFVAECLLFADSRIDKLQQLLPLVTSKVTLPRLARRQFQ
jgi:hypothetical protein